MSHKEKLAFIRQKCIEANGAKNWEVWVSSELFQEGGYFKDAECTLADVLIAIGKVTGYEGKCWMISPSGEFFCAVAPFKQTDWNLLKTLEEQDEATIDFIHSILK